MLDRDIILAVVAHRGRGERLLGVAARLRRREHGVLGLVAFTGMALSRWRYRSVTCASSSYSTRTSDAAKRAISDVFGDHQRDRLAVEQDLVVVERPERRAVRAPHRPCRRCRVSAMRGRFSCVSTSITPSTPQRRARVDARDAALRDGRRRRRCRRARPGTLNSAAYFAAPVTLARPSTREWACRYRVPWLCSPDLLG